MKAQPRTAAQALSRLPRHLQDTISRELEDGADWRAIAALCAEHGHPGVRPQNVTNYRQGAHQEWLRRQERLEALRRDSERTREVMEFYVREGGSPAEAGLLAAAEAMSTALGSLGPESLAGLIAENPKSLFAIVRELSRVTKILQAKKLQDPPAAEEEEAAPTLTPAQREARLKEIFGLS